MADFPRLIFLIGLGGLALAIPAFFYPPLGLYTLVGISVVGPALLVTCSPAGYQATGLSLLPVQILLMGSLTLRWLVGYGRIRLPLLVGIGLVIFLSGLSGLVNQTPVMAWLQGTFLISKSLWFLMLVLGLRFTEADFRRCIIVLGGYAIAHILLVAVQFVLWPPVMQDWYCGLLGRSSTGVGAVIMGYLFAYAYFLVRYRRQVTLGIVLIAGTFIPVVVGSAITGYGFLALALLLCLIQEGWIARHFARTIVTALVSVLMYALAFYGIWVWVLPNMPQGDMTRTVTRFLDPELLRAYVLVERPNQVVGRLKAPELILDEISSDPVKLLFGLGPGSMSQQSTFVEVGQADPRIADLAERTGGGGFGLERILAEEGMLGLGVVLLMIMWIASILLRLSARDRLRRDALQYITFPSFLVFVLSLLYAHGWYTDIIWLVPLLLVGYRVRVNQPPHELSPVLARNPSF